MVLMKILLWIIKQKRKHKKLSKNKKKKNKLNVHNNSEKKKQQKDKDKEKDDGDDDSDENEEPAYFSKRIIHKIFYEVLDKQFEAKNCIGIKKKELQVSFFMTLIEERNIRQNFGFNDLSIERIQKQAENYKSDNESANATDNENDNNKNSDNIVDLEELRKQEFKKQCDASTKTQIIRIAFHHVFDEESCLQQQEWYRRAVENLTSKKRIKKK